MEAAITEIKNGRLELPKEILQCVDPDKSGKCVVSVDPIEKVLILYSLENWEKVESDLNDSQSDENKSVRLLRRLILGQATELDIKGNSISITGMLRDGYLIENGHVKLVQTDLHFKLIKT